MDEWEKRLQDWKDFVFTAMFEQHEADEFEKNGQAELADQRRRVLIPMVDANHRQLTKAKGGA